MNPKNSKKSPIHENADANITCDFGDGDISRLGDFTVTSFAVSRGHPAPLVGKRLLAGGLRVYFCLDSCLVYINFAHTQDHDYVLYLCGGTSGVVWTACFSLLSSKKMENEENSG